MHPGMVVHIPGYIVHASPSMGMHLGVHVACAHIKWVERYEGEREYMVAPSLYDMSCLRDCYS